MFIILFPIANRIDDLDDLGQGFTSAARLIISLDSALLSILNLSMRVSLSAVFISCVIGFPVGALLAYCKFPGQKSLIVILNSLMCLPTVFVWLLVYMLLSRSGPFGVFGLLYTPTAMIIAQTLLVTPIIAALTRQILEDLWHEYSDYLNSLEASKIDWMVTLLWDARFSLATVLLAGFGRAIAEVGAVMIVGGNIDHVTRVMTTAIALETSKGNLSLALGLGIVLLVTTLIVNALAHLIRTKYN